MRVAVALGLAVGLLVGIDGYTFIYARGYSYLTNDPAACVNCHMLSLDRARKGQIALKTPRAAEPPNTPR
jgi:hypothetical protein